ncbi:ubiquitin carboxyl-terminal hydrolase 14 [Geobacter sp. SVR]|uniref:ubiquitin carboxyl-terminal hydrolase 14 n=1 Tax=Geobacter sp. SVR TaxID=2495594 RepID=UPI00143EFE48|nr:UBP-type zinc finger domain-containing protein [Geobacter sp. SVR]BCS55633.1 hypothetical protein GSVR_39410 [Geobacter sp. SVR]GCF83637.1 hypothetical protein GSbR_02370 [Geobacter sp. SVR]
MAGQCSHLEEVKRPQPRTSGCEECLKTGETWVHLRLCETCGHVGCCDSSKNKHATRHFHATQHPVIRSFQPGETWRYCYIDEQVVEPESDES